MQRGPVSIKDVADRAGVSVGTVSNALNRPDVVAEGTRQRVLAVIGELGFVRNGSASRLRSSRNTALGLVVIDVGNPFFTEVVRGAERMAEQLGYVMLLCDSDSTIEREDRHLRFLEEHRVAGILITPTTPERVRPLLRSLKEMGIAVVLLDEPALDQDQCSVAVDHILGGHIAGQHLLDIGRRRIGEGQFPTLRGAVRRPATSDWYSRPLRFGSPRRGPTTDPRGFGSSRRSGGDPEPPSGRHLLCQRRRCNRSATRDDGSWDRRSRRDRVDRLRRHRVRTDGRPSRSPACDSLRPNSAPLPLDFSSRNARALLTSTSTSPSDPSWSPANQPSDNGKASGGKTLRSSST